MFNLQPTKLSDEELVRYAQFYLDRKESMPLEWQQELLNRFMAKIDDLRFA